MIGEHVQQLESTRAAAVTVSDEQRFLFDLHGCLLLPGVLTASDCATLLATVQRLEAADYDEDERLSYTYQGQAPQPTLQITPGRTRLNGLLRLDPLFDQLIDHPGVLPYLEAFMQRPQLINTWSISKAQGEPGGGWHRGAPGGYAYRNGQLTSRMLNTVWLVKSA